MKTRRGWGARGTLHGLEVDLRRVHFKLKSAFIRSSVHPFIRSSVQHAEDAGREMHESMPMGTSALGYSQVNDVCSGPLRAGWPSGNSTGRFRMSSDTRN